MIVINHVGAELVRFSKVNHFINGYDRVIPPDDQFHHSGMLKRIIV